MNEQEIVAQLNLGLQRPGHSHSKRVFRPWWRWTLHWDSERHEPWIKKWDTVQVPCPTVLEPQSKVRVERERLGLETRYVASRQFHCAEPSVPGDHRVILYAAAVLDA